MQPAKRRLQAQIAGAERQLIEEFAEFYNDPLGFVWFAFPWGEGALKDDDGPDVWQIDILTELGEELVKREDDVQGALAAIQIAVSSGHGIGKTALIAWIILWFMSTREHPEIPVTAGKFDQLKTKTWRELAKWHKLAINEHWFEWTATRFYHKLHPETWYAAALAWSKHSPGSVAGTHEKHVLVIYDEAPNVDDKVWEATDGAMTTPAAIWIAFGNPTKNTGRFRRAFGDLKHRWITRQIDSRTCRKAHKAQLKAWVEDYGEDSDFVRIRVRGIFPRASANQLIDTDTVGAAVKRETVSWETSPRVMSVDVARHGGAQSVICKRQGAKVHPLIKYRIPDLMQNAARVATEINEWKPDVVFIDATGMGWGVVDRLRQLGYTNIIAVQVGERNPEWKGKWFNLRTKLYCALRDFLKDIGDIPNDPELIQQLEAHEYYFDSDMGIQLETKEEMEARGLDSPDCSDALSLQFAQPVPYAGTKKKPGTDRKAHWRAP